MAMFGGLAKKRSPFDFTPPIYSTPGIGDDLPGAKPMGDPGLGMAVGAAPQQKGGGWRDVLGVISEGLAGAAGNGPGVYMQSKMRDKEMQRQDSLYQRHRADQMMDWKAKQEWEIEHGQPQILNTGDGGIARVGRDGKIEMVRQPDPPQKGETERLIDAWASLPDSDPRKDVLRQAIRGAGFDPSVYRPKVDYETAQRLRVKTTAPGKAPSAGPRPRAAPKPPSGFILD